MFDILFWWDFGVFFFWVFSLFSFCVEYESVYVVLCCSFFYFFYFVYFPLFGTTVKSEEKNDLETEKKRKNKLISIFPHHLTCNDMYVGSRNLYCTKYTKLIIRRLMNRYLRILTRIYQRFYKFLNVLTPDNGSLFWFHWTTRKFFLKCCPGTKHLH